MSVTINTGELKFSVFGKGFENTRNDSGSGSPDPDYHNIGGVSLACIDQTNTYVWLTDEGNWLYKIKIDTWEFQSHSIPVGSIYHPCNVENNYGVRYSNNRVVVFDLTSGEIIKDISGSFGYVSGVCDCILVDDDIYLIQCAPQNGDRAIIHISLQNDTVSTSGTIWNNCVCGFADSNTIFGFWQRVWFSDNTRAYGYNLSGGVQWQANEDYGQQIRFSTTLQGLCGNGYLYLPTPKGDKYTLGVYDANSAPDFVTPYPIKTIGIFDSNPSLQWQYTTVNYCYNQGKTKAVFATSIGTFYTDFSKEVRKLNDNPSDMRPLAMNDRLVVSRVGNNQVSVYYL